MSINSKYAQYGNDNNNQNSGSSGSSGSGNRAPKLTVSPYTTVRGTLNYLYGSEQDWGQSLGVNFTDGKLVDGILMERVDKDDTYKVFAWNDIVVLDEGQVPTADDAPESHVESFPGGRTGQYRLVAARVEGDEENGVESDPAEPVPFGDFMIWESGQDEPSASAKTLAQVLTPLGRDIIVDRNDIHNWLRIRDENGDFAVRLRPDLEGREVDLIKTLEEGDNYNFHQVNVVDVKTGDTIFVGYGVDESDGDEEQDETPAPTTTDDEFPEQVRDFVNFCVESELEDDAVILDSLYQMVEADGNSFTEDVIAEVGGEEAVLQAIHNA